MASAQTSPTHDTTTVSAPTDGAPPAPARLRAMSLDEALAYARAQNPVLRAATARVRMRQAEAAIPRAQWYPTAGATAQFLAGTVNNSTAS